MVASPTTPYLTRKQKNTHTDKHFTHLFNLRQLLNITEFNSRWSPMQRLQYTNIKTYWLQSSRPSIKTCFHLNRRESQLVGDENDLAVYRHNTSMITSFFFSKIQTVRNFIFKNDQLPLTDFWEITRHRFNWYTIR